MKILPKWYTFQVETGPFFNYYIQDVGEHLADSLIKVVKMMPDWNPGKQDGKAVDVYYTLPMQIHFR